MRLAIRRGLGYWIVAVVVSGCSGASPKTLGVPLGNDDPVDTPVAVERFTFPPRPDLAQLLAFRVSTGVDAQYFVDPRSIETPGDDVVRMTIVARRPQVPDAVSYEGFRCAVRERRVYAYGRADHTWIAARPSVWRRMPAVTGADYASTLYREFFCPEGVSIASPREGVDALRRGIHPRLVR